MPKKSSELQEVCFGTKEFKARYCVEIRTQALWRKKGMPYIRVPNSAKILYRQHEIDAWLAQGKSM
jgi:hypothetical protein